MKGITFGELHSYDDLGLILTKKELGAPEVKEKRISIEGADGSIDLTDFFGSPRYGDVKHKFTFVTFRPPGQFPAVFSIIKNALHGQKMEITLDDDSSFCYVGRLEVSSFTNEKGIGTVSIEATCEPWKYKKSLTTAQYTIAGSTLVTLQNSRKRVVPTITASATMTYDFNDWSTTHAAGTFQVPEIELQEGVNQIIVTGNGTVTFSYREGVL